MNAGGLKDEDFKAAIREGRLDEVLAGLKVEQHVKNQNVINHWAVATMFHNVFAHGFPNGPWPTYTNNMWCNNIGLSTRDDEPSFSVVEQQYYGGYHNFADNASGTTGARGMTAHIAEANVYDKNPDGKEELFQRHRFLFIPSWAISNNIRSLSLLGSEYSNQGTGNEDRWISGRVRLKDPDTGLPIVIVKNLNQVLVIEYTIYWVAI
jgi:hypothetical protein